MHLMRIRERVINIDLVYAAQYLPADPDGHSEAPRAALWLSVAGAEPVALYGDDARAVWAALCRRAAVPEMVAAADDDDAEHVPAPAADAGRE